MGTWLKSNRDKCSALYEVKYLSILSNHKTNKPNTHPQGLGLDSCHHDTLLTFWTTMEKVLLVSSVQYSQRPPEKINISTRWISRWINIFSVEMQNVYSFSCCPLPQSCFETVSLSTFHGVGDILCPNTLTPNFSPNLKNWKKPLWLDFYVNHELYTF